MKEEKSCGAVILRHNDENDYDVLLVKHTAGHWGFPKGHVEGNETEEETAIREVKEETGYDCTIDNSFRETSSYLPKPGVHKQVVYFVGKIIGGEMSNDESEGIERVAWLLYSEALALLAYQSDVNILRGVRKYLQQYETEE